MTRLAGLVSPALRGESPADLPKPQQQSQPCESQKDVAEGLSVARIKKQHSKKTEDERRGESQGKSQSSGHPC